MAGTTEPLDRAELEFDEAHPLRNARVMANQGLVVAISKGFQGRGVEYNDLIQFGNLGLMRAAELFDASRGLKFSTYASYWIKNAIWGGIDGTGCPVRVPRVALQRARACERARRALMAGGGAEPSPEAVYDAAGISAKCRKWIGRAVGIVRAEFSHLSPATFDDMEGRPGPDPGDGLPEGWADVGAALEGLDADRRGAVLSCFGLSDTPSPHPRRVRGLKAAAGLRDLREVLDVRGRSRE